MLRITRVLVLALLPVLGSVPIPEAHADTIPGLWATGVDAAGLPLRTGLADPHWQLVKRPSGAGSGTTAFVVNDGYPIPPWLANSATSRWIGPKADQSAGSPPGDYTYRLQFDLSGFDPTTTMIMGRWSSDNAGAEVRLNGQTTGITGEGDYTAFSRPFVIRTGFGPGTNTLEFVVNNASTSINPTGFRAELQGTADPTPPPGTPPSIRRQPDDVTVSPGAGATFRVDATGAPPLLYQWRLGGTPLAAATLPTFTIVTATADSAGNYDVVVRNDVGSVTSRVARLVLRTPSPAERTWEPPGASTRRTGIAFSEILLRPLPRADGRQLAFVELHNTLPYPEDLSGWRLSGAFDFVFPTNTLLAADERLVVAAAPADLRATYRLAPNTPVLGGFTVRNPLADSGTLRLRKRSGAVLLEVAWNASDPAWPAAAFGPGHSLVLARPSLGERDPRAWAASDRRGGSPGFPEALPTGPLESLTLNECFAGLDAPADNAGDLSPFVELHNASPVRVDASGCFVQLGVGGPSIRIAEGTLIAPNGYLAVPAADLPLDRFGGLLLLVTPDESRVLDAVRYPYQPRSRSSGRASSPDHPWRLFEHPTPGAANAAPLVAPVTISEILARPISGTADDEFVEIHNPGTRTVSLDDWRFDDGIQFQFPANATLPAGGYGVVVPDRARFLALHPGVDPARVFGNSTGSLSNDGERLRLLRPDRDSDSVTPDPLQPFGMIAVDQVTFATATRWSRWADGGGSSLERIDVRADGDLAPNWADSDESGRAPWTQIERTGSTRLGHPSVASADQLQVMLLGAGECLVDDVEVLVAGQNRVINGGFETGITGWTFQGTHRLSRAETSDGFGAAGGHSLRLVASDRGDHVANRARTALRTPIPLGTTVTIRAKVRWLRGHPEILFRLRNGSLEAAARLDLPPFAGTPGAANSRRLDNAGPALLHVAHQPILPAANQPVRVTVEVSDPDGVGSVLLRYRADPLSQTADVPMTDDGRGPDELAGDGIYTGQIPGKPTGTLIAFRVVAFDAAEPAGPASFFPDASTECLVRFGETVATGAIPHYRLWMTRADHDRWANREKMSNEDVPVTFVFGEQRAIQAAGAHYSGSSYTSPGYTSPTGSLCGYNVRFPDGDGFLGDTQLTLDWPIRDDTDQREQLMFWFLEQFGLPNLHRRQVRLDVNGVRRGTIYDDVQQPGRDTVDEWFSGDDQGSLWKTDCWNEFDNSGNKIEPCVLNTLQRFPTTGPLEVARYRWNWRPRAVHGSANDFTDLFALVDVANTTPTAAYLSAVESQVDVDHWMRTFAMNDLASYWDGFGNPNAKNTFLYKPERDRWRLMCWDFDVGLGVFNDPPTAALFDVNDPTITRMYRTPSFVRRYWAALDEAVNGFFKTGAGTPIDTLLDTRYAAFRANGLALAEPSGIKTWINQRRSYLLGQLATVRAPFAITTRAGANFATNREPIALTGTAPVGIRYLTVNDTLWPVDWTTVTNWSIPVSLQPGSNVLRVAGLDFYGRPVSGSSDSIAVTFNGAASAPAALRVNEWMAANRTTLADPADGDFDDWFELFNAGAEPVDLTSYSLTDDPARPRRFVIPPGFVLAPGAFLLVWTDGEPDQTRAGTELHANFRLDQDGSDLLVFDRVGRLVDAVQFGHQSPDITEGRWGDGAAALTFRLSQPTPGAPNAAPTHANLDLAFTGQFEPASRSVVLGWTASDGRRYAIDAKDRLDDALPWEALAEFPASTGGPRVFREAIPSTVTERFYRVRLLP